MTRPSRSKEDAYHLLKGKERRIASICRSKQVCVDPFDPSDPDWQMDERDREALQLIIGTHFKLLSCRG